MSPTSDTPVANSTPFVRNLVARALRIPPRMDESAFNHTASEFLVAEENDETPEEAPKSTGRLSSNNLAFNRKRRASTLEGAATNIPQHSSRTQAPVANETELEDYNGEGRNGSVVTGLPTHASELKDYDEEEHGSVVAGLPTHANELEDYDEEERDGSVVDGPPTHANELEDCHEEALGTISVASLPPSAKKLCTGLSNKVLVIDGETFLLPEGRGDVGTLERDETMSGRLGHMLHPRAIIIDGQMFRLPRGGGDVVALGQNQRRWMEEVEQRKLNYTDLEEEDHQQEQETDSELEGWINNYHYYMDSRYEEGQELENERDQEEERKIDDLERFRSEESGNKYVPVPDVEEGEQTIQSDTAGPSSEKSPCILCGEYHSPEPEEEAQSQQSDSEDSKSDATRASSEQYLCMHCGGYHHLSEADEESTEQNDSEDSMLDYPEDWMVFESDEELYNEHDANVESDINDEVPPTDSGYDSEMDGEDDSDSSDSSDSDLSSDDSFDYDYDNDGGGEDNVSAQAPTLVVDDPILYGPTDLPEGHVRGEMMFVLNGELWGIDFTN